MVDNHNKFNLKWVFRVHYPKYLTRVGNETFWKGKVDSLGKKSNMKTQQHGYTMKGHKDLLIDIPFIVMTTIFFSEVSSVYSLTHNVDHVVPAIGCLLSDRTF